MFLFFPDRLAPVPLRTLSTQGSFRSASLVTWQFKMAAERALGLQLQVRQNAAELQDYLRDLDRWESDIKQKDEELRKAKVVHKKVTY